MARFGVLVAACLLASAASAQERPGGLRGGIVEVDGVLGFARERATTPVRGATAEVELQLRSLIGSTVVVEGRYTSDRLTVERLIDPHFASGKGVVLRNERELVLRGEGRSYVKLTGPLADLLPGLDTREVEFQVRIPGRPSDVIYARGATLLGLRAWRGGALAWIRDARGSEVLFEPIYGPRRWVPLRDVVIGRQEGTERRRVRGPIVWNGPATGAVLRVGGADYLLESEWSGRMDPDFWEGREIEVEGVAMPMAGRGPQRFLVERWISPTEEHHWQPYRGTLGAGPVLITRRAEHPIPLRPAGPLTSSLEALQEKYAPNRRLVQLLETLVGQEVEVLADLMRDAAGKDTEMVVRRVKAFSRTRPVEEHMVIDYVDGKVRTNKTRGEWIPLGDLKIGRGATAALEGR